MQILSNLLLDVDALLQPVSTDISGNTRDISINIAADATAEQSFAQQLDSQLAAITAPLSQLNIINPETTFPSVTNAGQVLPLNNLPVNNTNQILSTVALENKHAEPATLSNIQSSPALLGNTSLAADTLLSHGSDKLLKNSAVTITAADYIARPDIPGIKNNTNPLSVKDSQISLDSTQQQEQFGAENIKSIRDNDIQAELAQQRERINLEQIKPIDVDESIDSNLFLIKNQAVKLPEELSDLNTFDKNILGFNKVTESNLSIPRESQAINSTENYTLKADGEFTEQFGEKIDLLIRNNQKEAKISLEPAGLGKIDIQIKMHNNEYVVNIFTQNEGAQQILDQHSAKLKQLFNQQDMTFNLSQQNNPNHSQHEKGSQAQLIDGDQFNHSAGKNSADSSKNINSYSQYFMLPSVLSKESVSLYI